MKNVYDDINNEDLHTGILEEELVRLDSKQLINDLNARHQSKAAKNIKSFIIGSLASITGYAVGIVISNIIKNK